MHTLSYRTLSQLGRRKGLGGGGAGAELLASGCEAVAHRRPEGGREILGLLFPVYQETGLEGKKTKAWTARRETFQKPRENEEEGA